MWRHVACNEAQPLIHHPFPVNNQPLLFCCPSVNVTTKTGSLSPSVPSHHMWDRSVHPSPCTERLFLVYELQAKNSILSGLHAFFGLGFWFGLGEIVLLLLLFWVQPESWVHGFSFQFLLNPQSSSRAESGFRIIHLPGFSLVTKSR